MSTAMEVFREPHDGPAILRVTGSVDATSAGDFEQRVGQLLELDTDRQVLMDCGALEYVSSSGLRVLMVLLKKLTARRGALALCGLQEPVRNVFEISGLDLIFTIRKTREDALAALGGLPPAR